MKPRIKSMIWNIRNHKTINQNNKKKKECKKKMLIRMLKELSADLSSIKKIQSEMKDTLIEIKNNLQGTTVERMKLRIKSMIYNIRKQ